MKIKKQEGKVVILLLLNLILSVGLILFISIRLQGVGDSKESNGWGKDKARKYANKLRAEGLPLQASIAYEEFLDLSDEAARTRANAYFSIGKAFMEKKWYEDALAYFYKAEIADPDTSLKKEIGARIVQCLERLGKSMDARAAAEERVTISQDGKASEEGARGELVARVGNRMITMAEIHDRVSNLPEYVQNRYKDPEKKTAFVQQYIVNKVLLKKAIALGLHKGPKVREQIELAQEGIILHSLLQQEITEAINPDDHDLKTYYEANQENYLGEDEGEVLLYEEVRSQVKWDYLLEKAEVKMKGYVSKLFIDYDVEVFYKSEINDTAAKKEGADNETPEEEAGVESSATQTEE